jgi:predicted NBD/HSP70 family sugar kinase
VTQRGLAGTNLEQARGFNRRVVLETVRLYGPLSRAEVSRATSLSVQTISNIAEELRDAGLLLETPRRASTRGAPGFDLALNPEGGFTFGVSLDHRRLSVLLVDLAGEVRGSTGRSLADAEPEKVLAFIGTAVGGLIDEARIDPTRIWGVGVVLPGLFEHGSLVRFGPTSVPQWSGFPLVDRLSQQLAMPVLVENDATAAAIGEALYGTSRSLTDFFYIHVGPGIGGGMILSGHPYRGSGNAGELGHIVTESGGRPCLCGNHGCLERYASLATAMAAVTGADEADVAVDLDVLELAHAAGAPALLRWLDEAAKQLGRAIVIIENLLDPQTIVLGGSMPASLLDALAARLDPLPPGLGSWRTANQPRLIRATSGLDTPALGAAALPVFEGMVPSFALLAKTSRAGPARLRIA